MIFYIVMHDIVALILLFVAFTMFGGAYDTPERNATKTEKYLAYTLFIAFDLMALGVVFAGIYPLFSEPNTTLLGGCTIPLDLFSGCNISQ